ncbi:MAG: hypothetical protein AAF950_13040, partial [Pseudomonadota bacterium]
VPKVRFGVPAALSAASWAAKRTGGKAKLSSRTPKAIRDPEGSEMLEMIWLSEHVRIREHIRDDS